MDTDQYLTTNGWVQDCSNLWNAPHLPASVWIKTDKAVAVQEALDRGEPYHAHLEVCEQCANHPFALCPTGDRTIHEQAGVLLRRA